MERNERLFGFEKLVVWNDARGFISEIYKLTDNFPSKERFGLSSQLQRAAVSIAANIAEGSSRFSKKEFARYIQISYGSLMEVLSHAYVAYDRTYIVKVELKRIRENVKMISNKLNSLSRSLK